MTKNYRK